MMIWEYMTVPVRRHRRLGYPTVEAMFDAFGWEFWELVSVDRGVAFFKRGRS
jgi:hypothetical protein